MHLAAENGSTAAAKILLNAKAIADLTDKYGMNALHLAAKKGHNDVLGVLVASHANMVPSIVERESWQ